MADLTLKFPNKYSDYYGLLSASTSAADFPRTGSSLDFSGLTAPLYLDNCYITRTGLVLNSSKELIRETCDEHCYWIPRALSIANNVGVLQNEIDSRINYLREQVARLSFVNIPAYESDYEYVYLMHPFGWYAYGHLFDTLQRLFPIESRAKGSRTLILSDSRRILSFSDHLHALGYGSKQVQYIQPGFDAIKVRRLLFSYSPAAYTQFTNDTIDWIRECYLPYTSNHVSTMLDSIGSYVLWLDRSLVARRSISNQDEIIDSLRRIGYKVIMARGNESFSEMLALYSKAEYIIGSHGAMFVNTIFASEDSKIIEICPESRRVSNMLRMSKPARNHVLTFWNSDEDCNISIEPSQMIDLMKALG